VDIGFVCELFYVVRVAGVEIGAAGDKAEQDRVGGVFEASGWGYL